MTTDTALPGELAAAAEVAAILGVSRQWASTYTTQQGFPEPAAYLTCGTIWHVKDVVAWAKRRGRDVHLDAYRELLGETRTRRREALGG